MPTKVSNETKSQDPKRIKLNTLKKHRSGLPWYKRLHTGFYYDHDDAFQLKRRSFKRPKDITIYYVKDSSYNLQLAKDKTSITLSLPPQLSYTPFKRYKKVFVPGHTCCSKTQIVKVDASTQISKADSMAL